MTKQFCDRCGKEIESLDSVFIEVIDINRDFFHLCKDCYDEFNRWRKAAKPVQEIIRCKDCVYYLDEYGSCGRTDIIRSDTRIIMPDWYCADGKRKDTSNEPIK